MNEVTAEVVEVPKPQWPTLYVAAGIVVEDGSWMVTGSSHGMEEARRNLLDFADPIVTAIVPASTAAPEPDWVAELVDGRPMHYVKMNKPAKDRWRATLLNIYDEVLAFGEGPTPAMAAKACVERLRAGGAT